MQNFAGFLPWKWGIPIAIFSRQKLNENSILCAMMHLRQSTTGFLPQKQGKDAAEFSPWKFGIDSKRIEKALIGIMPIPKSNLKAQNVKSPVS